MSTVPVTRHFVTIGGARQVHYRRAGSGPPILVLHQSPASSREMLHAMDLLAGHFTVIAPDTPGNGQSDPLPIDRPEMEDFADAVVALLDALGLHDPVPVYGYHTGGVCALAMAVRHPARVRLAVMNGYIQLDEAERTLFLEHYMVPFVPDWSGSHLAWAWSRFRDQYLFFPWFQADAAHRLRTSLPSADYIQAAIMDMMRVGDNYRGSYRTAFSFDTGEAVRTVRAPLAIFSSETDLLAPYLDRMPALPANVSVHRCPSPPATQAAVARHLIEHDAGGQAPAVPPTAPVAGRLWNRFVQVEGLQMLVRACDEGAGRPVLFVHDISQSSASVDRFAAPLAGRRPVIAVDLPGNGESDGIAGIADPIIALQARSLAGLLRWRDGGPVDLVAVGAGCAVAAELARNEPRLVASLTLLSPRIPGARGGAEEISAEAEPLPANIVGSHWLRAWHGERDKAIFSPSHLRRREDSLPVDPDDLDAFQLHVQTVDRFKAAAIHAANVREVAAYPLWQALGETLCPVRIVNDRHGLHALVAGAVDERLLEVAEPRGGAEMAEALLRVPG